MKSPIMHDPARFGLILMALLYTLSIFAQTEAGRPARKAPQRAEPQPSTPVSSKDAGGIALLQRAEAEAAVLDLKMRAWALWQIGLAYQARDKAKALEEFEMALASSRAVHETASSQDSLNDLLAKMTGQSQLSPGLRLQANIARSIVLLEPKRADAVVGQVDPAVRGIVLGTLLACQEKQKQFDQAIETLNRIAAMDEMPYDHAMRLMDMLKPEQSGELLQLFTSALSSYRDHAPHAQYQDLFPVLLSRCWRRLPKEAVRQAIDEMMKQAKDADEEISYSVQSDKDTATLNSLYELRLDQIMPILREFDPAAARGLIEKHPVLASAKPPFEFPASGATGKASFHPASGYAASMLLSMEMPLAQKAVAAVESGNTSDAMSQASGITQADLRAQTYEYIARAMTPKEPGAASDAIQEMLHAAATLRPADAFGYYASAAEIDMRLDRVDDAKAGIEAGLRLADKLFQVDSDDDDPNTALKAFWPSTNAYSAMLRQSAHISHAWAISLLDRIDDPEVRVAAEIALAGGWLDAPIGPVAIMTARKKSHSSWFGPNP